jgi:GNAT superfamily N-acetyltransferase
MIIREAVRTDLDAILALLVNDELGKNRDFPVVDERYEAAFAAIDNDSRTQLIVGDEDGEVVACMQITYIPGLGRHGGERSHVEAVRVRGDRRGTGLGGELMMWAIGRARERGCALVELTSDKRRPDAHRFYTRLGFIASHEGMKLMI